MIIYDSNQPSEALRLEGSNIPLATLYTMPSVLLSLASSFAVNYFPEELDWLKNTSFSQMWSASVIVVGLLLAMRTNKAYDRFWEGITLVQLVRAEWFEAASNLVAFSLVAVKQDSANFKTPVNDFQYTLVRLMSLMHGAALKQIGGHQEDFEVLDLQAIDGDSLSYLAACEANGVNPVEVLLQWVQVLVTDCVTNGVLSVPAPILTRCFQTLSRGMVNLHDCRKLAECPFPFPLTQMVWVLLILQAIVTPIFMGATVKHAGIAAIMTFVPIFGMFSITFTAGELEHPFGNDPNDLPLGKLQRDYNKSLLMLLDNETFWPPYLVSGSATNVDSLRMKYSKSRTSSLTCCIGLDPSDLSDAGDSSDNGSMYGASQDEQWYPPIRKTTSRSAILDDDDKSNFSVQVSGMSDKPHGMDPQPPDWMPPSLNLEREFVQSLAEECVGALTNVITKLWHHRPPAALHHIDAPMTPHDIADEHPAIRASAKESALHRLHNEVTPESNGNVIHHPPDTNHIFSVPPPDEVARSLIALGEETCRSPPPEASGPPIVGNVPKPTGGRGLRQNRLASRGRGSRSDRSGSPQTLRDGSQAKPDEDFFVF